MTREEKQTAAAVEEVKVESSTELVLQLRPQKVLTEWDAAQGPKN